MARVKNKSRSLKSRRRHKTRKPDAKTKIPDQRTPRQPELGRQQSQSPSKGPATQSSRPESSQELLIPITRAILPGYTYVPKGNVYITRHCRSETLASGQNLYVIHATGNPKQTLGLGVPTGIVLMVRAQADATEATRAAAVDAKDLKDLTLARTALIKMYPKLPSGLTDKILSHGFKKNSGRVGRAGALDLDQRIRLAVQAHARHMHTQYDTLLKTTDRESARKKIKDVVDELIGTWSGRGVSKKQLPRPKGSKTVDKPASKLQDKVSKLQRSQLLNSLPASPNRTTPRREAALEARLQIRGTSLRNLE